MQSLSLALRNRGSEGEKLPDVFPQLSALGVHFRRGWVHLIAGAPGGGKSALATFMALNMDETGFGDRIPTLYISPDNDKMTFGKMALAPALHSHTSVAEEKLIAGDEEAYAALDEATDHLWVNFQAAPSPSDIGQELDAFATVYGEWPGLVIIDNLMDINGDGGGYDERTTQDAMLDWFKRKARETGAAFIVLCHVTGQYTDGLEPIPRSGLINKIDKRPQLVGTLYRVDDNILGFCVVKNRSGRAMADASLQAHIPWLAEMAWMGTGENQ
jgi:hypothetical protein